MTDITRPGRTYTITVAGWMILYVVLLVGVIYGVRQGTVPEGPLRYALALLPAIPVAGVMFAVGKLMRDSDEYVRALMAVRFITAAGITFTLATAWGFLEAIAGAPHIELYWVFVAFWIVYPLCTALVRNVR